MNFWVRRSRGSQWSTVPLIFQTILKLAESYLYLQSRLSSASSPKAGFEYSSLWVCIIDLTVSLAHSRNSEASLRNCRERMRVKGRDAIVGYKFGSDQAWNRLAVNWLFKFFLFLIFLYFILFFLTCILFYLRTCATATLSGTYNYNILSSPSRGENRLINKLKLPRFLFAAVSNGQVGSMILIRTSD